MFFDIFIQFFVEHLRLLHVDEVSANGQFCIVEGGVQTLHLLLRNVMNGIFVNASFIVAKGNRVQSGRRSCQQPFPGLPPLCTVGTVCNG